MKEENKATEVKMEVNNKSEEQKLSYEQLNDACAQLFQQNQSLRSQLQQANMTNMFKRLDYLFLVLKYADKFNDSAFISSCVDEIKEAMTVPAEEDKKEE